jgi:uncharacterized membrane protein
LDYLPTSAGIKVDGLALLLEFQDPIKLTMGEEDVARYHHSNGEITTFFSMATTNIHQQPANQHWGSISAFVIYISAFVMIISTYRRKK